jgi:hypothetical protein
VVVVVVVVMMMMMNGTSYREQFLIYLVINPCRCL